MCLGGQLKGSQGKLSSLNFLELSNRHFAFFVF